MSLRGNPSLNPTDLLVVLISLALITSPFWVATVFAVEPSIIEGATTVDQKVTDVGMISDPIGLTFGKAKTGLVDGSVSWETYSTHGSGMKLVLSASSTPALKDTTNAINIPDAGNALSDWSVHGTKPAFGFSASGGNTLGRYDSGKKWRGFSKVGSVELARKSAPFPLTSTQVSLRANYGALLASNSTPSATIYATAVANL